MRDHDVVKLHVVSSPAPQVLRAKLRRIYSARRGIDHNWLDSEIEFVGGPGTWGHVSLEVGEEAIAFICSISGQLYEDAWHGHMVVEKIDGAEYAIYPHRELWLNDKIPEAIRANSRPVLTRPYASAIHLKTLEAYLLALIDKSDER